jgi:hypothetical protein
MDISPYFISYGTIAIKTERLQKNDKLCQKKSGELRTVFTELLACFYWTFGQGKSSKNNSRKGAETQGKFLLFFHAENAKPQRTQRRNKGLLYESIA